MAVLALHDISSYLYLNCFPSVPLMIKGIFNGQRWEPNILSLQVFQDLLGAGEKLSASSALCRLSMPISKKFFSQTYSRDVSLDTTLPRVYLVARNFSGNHCPLAKCVASAALRHDTFLPRPKKARIESASRLLQREKRANLRGQRRRRKV